MKVRGRMRKHIKVGLVLAGILMIALGVLLRILEPSIETEDEPVCIWEELHEEENTYFKETESKQDIQVAEPVQECEAGKLKKEPAPAAGTIDLTYEEAQLLMRVAEAEAGNQGEDGMWMVMSVVVNRVNDEAWPDTIKEVIYQTSQFSSVADGHFDAAVISPEAHEALARLEGGDVAPEIIGFETTDSTENDKYFDEAYVYRDHKFYVKKGD